MSKIDNQQIPTYIAWKTLLSTLITYVGERSEKERMRVCVKLSHFSVHLKLTQQCKSTILEYKIKIKN